MTECGWGAREGTSNKPDSNRFRSKAITTCEVGILTGYRFSLCRFELTVNFGEPVAAKCGHIHIQHFDVVIQIIYV